ncbi:MAG: Pyridoxal-phosphate dependent enzyme [candidate division WS6 bacterium OLB20]|uniref:Pyridoxal-phosphate dependent enzyme n=1 Tax=candidate division WS6 bacterium OLB20 TaxID=1617426 RepID=A0A136M0Q0_9BACT|nr:MAG: Pyridoxal-phosphate dependent enzyme [candidate division WS6 bacterium OLB20]
MDELKKYEGALIRIHSGRKAKSDAILFARHHEAVNLRGSKDEAALPGFATIASELAEQIPHIDAVFIPCSSATSSVAIAREFIRLQKNVAVHVCQNVRINPIAGQFDSDFLPAGSSLSDCIVDRVVLRRNDVTELIRASDGSGWVISDEQLLNARDAAPGYSFNSLLALAAWQKAVAHGYEYKYPVAVMSGR